MSSTSSETEHVPIHERMDQSVTMKDQNLGKVFSSKDYKLVKDLLGHQTLLTIEPNRTLDRALQMMTFQNIHHLPVVTKHTRELVGLISERDLRLASASPLFDQGMKSDEVMKKLSEHKVSECMSKSVYTVTEDESILTAAKLMRVSKRGALVVLSGNSGGASKKVVGIITRVDLLDQLIRELEPISKEEQEEEIYEEDMKEKVAEFL